MPSNYKVLALWAVVGLTLAVSMPAIAAPGTGNAPTNGAGNAPGGPSGSPPADLAAFTDTEPLTGNQATPSSLAGKMRVESAHADNTSVEVLRSNATNYTIAITVTGNATNVTFYLQEQAVSSSQNISNVSMYLDGQSHVYYVDESAGPGNSPWIAFQIDHFSTRDVSFVESSSTADPGSAPPPVVGASAPTDTDGDGAYDDVNGDGARDVNDVTALWANRNSDAVQNNPASFDVNGDGGFDVNDVTALWGAVRNG